MSAMLDVVDVTQSYGSGSDVAIVLHAVSVQVAAAEIVALAGRSGSGKSTLCHLIAGLERPAVGTIHVAGRPAHTIKDWAAVSLLPQRLGLADELTVAENVLLPRRLRPGRAAATSADALLAALGLASIAGRLATQTSLGEQQRTAIARALVLDPDLAVLDEPTGHQDDERVDLVLAALKLAQSAGTAILVATHDERILAAADRVVRLQSGRVVDGP